MKILVTGGAGFIGFHTVKSLSERGDTVIIVDSFNEYYDVSLKEARARILDELGVKVIRADITDYAVMDQIFQDNKFDKICHLAAQAGVRYSLEKPLAYGHTNTKGTLVLLELCRQHGVKDFIFASSSSVYGGNTKMPFSETDRVDTPLSLYAATKKSNEEMAYTYHHLYGLNCTGLRFFTVYGPYGRPDMALFKFMKAGVEGRPIHVYNNGDMKRDFTFVSDIVAGIVAAIDKSYPYEIFNIGRGQPVQLMEYIAALEKHAGIVLEKDMMPMQPGDVPATWADISKARQMLGYDPQVSVEEGVKKFVEWYKEFYGCN